MNAEFILSNLLLGTGLAMDAFSASVADAFAEPGMPRRKGVLIASVFAFFQALMPMTGRLLLYAAERSFAFVTSVIPYIAFALLAYVGGRMIYNGVNGREAEARGVGAGALLAQGVATSIDALSAGFAMDKYSLMLSLAASLIIAAVTFVICVIGALAGRRFSSRTGGKAQTVGGIILIAIGVKILLEAFL